VPINKLRIFYFFAKERDQVHKFINSQRGITLNLYHEKDKIGETCFELTDFLSDNVIKREMFKLFAGKDLPTMSWGIKITVGLAECNTEEVSRVKLTQHKNIYLTSPEYYTCDPLPDEWIEIFGETHHNIENLLSKSDMRSSRYSFIHQGRDSPKQRRPSYKLLSPMDAAKRDTPRAGKLS